LESFLKFSTVLGAVSGQNSITISPLEVLITATSSWVSLMVVAKSRAKVNLPSQNAEKSRQQR